MSSAIRRLDDASVRLIFEALHSNNKPPPHLPFLIVAVGSDGQRLSPPSYEFNDGLYVLLKPRKKKIAIDAPGQPSVPSNLVHMMMKDDEEPALNCPWSLSGPQFPQPTAIQQRYCYPKGNPEYSSKKGGALWTMYGQDGKEDLEFRLLHVYFSAKRAGVKASPSPRKKMRKSKSTPRFRSPAGVGKSCLRRSPARLPRGDTKRVIHPPGMPTSEAPSSPPEDQLQSNLNSSAQVYITPQATNSRSNRIPLASSSHLLTRTASFASNNGDRAALEHEALTQNLDLLASEFWDGNFHSSVTISNYELDDHVPPKSLLSKEKCLNSLGAKLDTFHKVLRDFVLIRCPVEQQPMMIAMISDWARNVASDPIGFKHYEDLKEAEVDEVQNAESEDDEDEKPKATKV